jgi:hypothetical protein
VDEVPGPRLRATGFKHVPNASVDEDRNAHDYRSPRFFVQSPTGYFYLTEVEQKVVASTLWRDAVG